MEVRRRRSNRVPEADIDLNVDACFCKARLHDSTNPAVRIVLTDRMHLEVINIEHQAVVINFRCGDVANGGSDSRFGGLAKAEKIEVSCWPVSLADSDREQHGTLQDEPVSVLRLRQSIQEPLGSVVHERQREIFAPLLRHLEQSCPHGCRYIDWRLARHDDIASQ